MLPKRQRLSRHDIESLKRDKKVINSSLFFINYYFYDNEELPKIGFSASKKVSSKAVIRNKIRRWGYKILTKYINRLKKGILLQFVYKKTPVDLEEVEKNIYDILVKSQSI